jgi:hypothetical protein
MFNDEGHRLRFLYECQKPGVLGVNRFGLSMSSLSGTKIYKWVAQHVDFYYNRSPEVVACVCFVTRCLEDKHDY